MADGISPATKTLLQKIPLLTIKAGPRDGDQWVARLKEEYSRLIEYIKINKEQDNDWFKIESNKTGTRWTGKCWYFHDNVRYEFDLQFEIPVTYPVTPIELQLPELDGKTSKVLSLVFSIKAL
jgi:ufm1-conjugating enzyme 1